MAVTSVNSSATAQNLQTAQSQAQLGMLKKANDLQADQVKQLLDAQQAQQAQAQQVQTQKAVEPTQRSGRIDTYA
ncbi:hypothetical protein Q9Q94_13120 [Uliginosibacterium sp. 31-16]|uniref:hypothetical protein n=1 Tax=Uliginosibacterium sp. 31-16 TaxID=3068315 RepID=UPI00273F6578|nr:hypothetical protein [Uliginosibacterium sp. 31-16]MDP5240478.1 hypothetical protein [Uliginosibacterium sp. 31-16]